MKHQRRENENKEKLSEAIGNIEDDYILEALEYNEKKKPQREGRMILLRHQKVVSFTVGVMACGFVLFLLVSGGNSFVHNQNEGDSKDSVLSNTENEYHIQSGSAGNKENEKNTDGFGEGSNNKTENHQIENMENQDMISNQEEKEEAKEESEQGELTEGDMSDSNNYASKEFCTIQGKILEAVYGDSAFVIVQVHKANSEIQYSEVKFYLEQDMKHWGEEIGSYVEIHSGISFQESYPAIGELYSIKKIDIEETATNELDK